MYADREEAAMARRRKASRRDNNDDKRRRVREMTWSRSPRSSVSRSVSPSRSPPPVSPRRPGDVEMRERELQEQLRRRAMLSKGSRGPQLANDADGDRSSSTKEAGHDEKRSRTSNSPEAPRKRRSDGNTRQSGRDSRHESGSEGESSTHRDRHRMSRHDSVDRRGRERSGSIVSHRSRRREDDDDDRYSRRGGTSRRGGDSDDDRDYDRCDRRDRRDRRSDRRSSRHYGSPYSPYSNAGGGHHMDPYYGGYMHYDHRYGPPPPYYDRRRYGRSPSPPPRRRRGDDRPRSPDLDDYELRSIFCQQLAARLTQRDLGEFFEEKLGDGTVLDVKIVMDKITGRSKGVGYVELKDEALVEKALNLSGTVVCGIPIVVQKTEAARNKGRDAAAASNGAATGRAALPAPPNASLPEQTGALPKLDGNPIHIDPGNLPNVNARLYVGNLNFNLTDADVRSVFEPFGTILSVDLHREPGTLKSKGFAFVQFADPAVAEKAIEHMNGFELASRNIRVGHVNAAKQGDTNNDASKAGARSTIPESHDASGATATLTSAFDEGGGGGLTASSRAALMEKLAGIDRSESTECDGIRQTATPPVAEAASLSSIPSAPQVPTRGVFLKNMFDPAEETEPHWDQDLADDVKEECANKYGAVEAIKVDANSKGEVYMRFADITGAQRAVHGLNGRFFGGRSIEASFINDGILASVLS